MLILNFFVEGIAAIMLLLDHNNLFLFHFLNPVQFFLISSYIQKLVLSAKAKFAILVITLMAILTSIIFSFTIQPINEYNSYWLLLQNLLVCIFILYYFYEQTLNTNTGQKHEKSILLVNIGLFIYAITNLFIGGFLNPLIKYNVHIALYVYFGSVLVSYITYILFIFAFKAEIN